MIGKTNATGMSIDLSSLSISADKVASGTKFINNDGEINIGTLPYLNTSTFGNADETSFDQSPIIDKAWNQYVGAFDYNLNGYFNGLTRVHIPNMIPANIKAGVKVGGKNAYLEGTFTSDANAQSQYMLSGQTAYVNGNKITGSMPYIGAHDTYKRLDQDGNSLYVAMTNGAHIENADIGYPRVLVPYNAIANATGVTSDKIIKGQSCLNVSGSKDYLEEVHDNFLDKVTASAIYTNYSSFINALSSEDGLVYDSNGPFWPDWPNVVFMTGIGVSDVACVSSGARYIFQVKGEILICVRFLRDMYGGQGRLKIYVKAYVPSGSYASNATITIRFRGGISSNTISNWS